jgi:hypothetical protein
VAQWQAWQAAMAAAAQAKPEGGEGGAPGKLTLNVATGSSGSDGYPVEALAVEASLQVRRQLGLGQPGCWGRLRPASCAGLPVRRPWRACG